MRRKASKLALISVIAIAGCATPASVTPKPDIRPVAQSNKAIKEHVTEIRKGTSEALKINKDLQGDIDSALGELNKLDR
jgi:hypothetical protein